MVKKTKTTIVDTTDNLQEDTTTKTKYFDEDYTCVYFKHEVSHKVDWEVTVYIPKKRYSLHIDVYKELKQHTILATDYNTSDKEWCGC